MYNFFLKQIEDLITVACLSDPKTQRSEEAENFPVSRWDGMFSLLPTPDSLVSPLGIYDYPGLFEMNYPEDCKAIRKNFCMLGLTKSTRKSSGSEVDDIFRGLR